MTLWSVLDICFILTFCGTTNNGFLRLLSIQKISKGFYNGETSIILDDLLKN
jgi:hypothetical protein